MKHKNHPGDALVALLIVPLIVVAAIYALVRMAAEELEWIFTHGFLP